MTAVDGTPPGERARRELREALADGAGDAAALRALGASLQWAAAALARARESGDGATALEAFFDLFDALERLPGLAEEAPRLAAAARPGERPAEQLDRRLTELAELDGRVRDDLTTLKRLAAAEDELRGRLAEHAELRERVDELRRLERLTEALDALAGQQQAVDERLKSLRSRDTSAADTLAESCEALVRLTDEQLESLGPRTRDALREAEQRTGQLAVEQRQLTRTTADLDAVRARLEEIRAELGERVPELERYARADRELAEALTAEGDTSGSTLERARAQAAEVERRLAEIDGVLRAALP